MFTIVVFWLGDMPSALIFFEPASLLSIYPRLSSYLLLLFLYLILFLLFPFTSVRENMHEFPISYSHTEWYPSFSRDDMISRIVKN